MGMFVRLSSSLWSLLNPTRCRFASVGDVPLSRRVLKVGLIGIPNAGKSELTNRLIGQKVTAVSSKKNTTTACQLGAYMSGSDTQIVLHDLPGVLRSRDAYYRGQMARVETAWTMAEHCDVVTFIVDAALVTEKLLKGRSPIVDAAMLKAIPVFDLAEHIQKIKESRGHAAAVILALNKIDLIPRTERFKLAVLEDILRERCDFERVFCLSALKNIGIPKLKAYFHSVAKDGDWVLPPGVATDKSSGQLAVELVKEKLYRRLNREVPYRLDVDLIREGLSESGKRLFEVIVWVPNNHVKKIVVGRGGSVIDEYVTQKTREELESAFQKSVVLLVHVKLRP